LVSASRFSLEGRTALLTGATGFLGRRMAEALLSHGSRLLALGRSDRMETLGEDWSDRFGAERVRVARIDMYDESATRELIRELIDAEESVDVLVNNAHELGPASGFNVEEGSLERSTSDQWRRNLAGGLMWPLLSTQAVGPVMKRQGRGSIINVATMYAAVAPSPRLYEGTDLGNPPGYSAAKAGLVAFTRYVASYWGPYGIRANAILPGPFSNTEEAGPNAVGADDPFLERLAARTCLGRIGSADELAGPLVFLASDASSYVTGHALMVDGGWTTT
jgi:NAD(P)-dependent dehydrogenase (short-subunit alcohol dehydrogenase family)